MPAARHTDETWIKRTFDLAKQGIGHVSPNPPVGAVLVHDNRIIGEGFHQKYGGDHAEVEAIRSVNTHDRKLIQHASLYVSLEPCCITAKTPPCTDLIIREGIRDVRISTIDPNPKIAGKGIALLESKGIKVTHGILKEEGEHLIRAFAVNILYKRPYIILKWAQSKEGYIGETEKRVMLSHPYSSIWSHGQRGSVDAVIAGARTIRIDNPFLTTRHSTGKSPARVIYDPNASLDESYHVFRNDGVEIFYFSQKENTAIQKDHIRKYVLVPGQDDVQRMCEILFEEKKGIILVEGGAHLMGRFIEMNRWDEAWVIQTPHPLASGVKAPNVTGHLMERMDAHDDVIIGIKNTNR
jgi:diaminohydroxyphosphoribosylaminopyrimidine deaminase/5-amino-6-(5-phosphoribosylamino)uracil reductase